MKSPDRIAAGSTSTESGPPGWLGIVLEARTKSGAAANRAGIAPADPERLESIGTLAGGIANELNNVLSPILMGVELLTGRPGLDPESLAILGTIEQSARHGSDIVRQVLMFAKGTEGRRPLLPPDPDAVTLPRGCGELVLVVDDELGMRDILTRMLEQYGYKVLAARDGAEAVTYYAERAGEVSVVLTDMMMPLMDGPATARALLHIDPRVKLIGMSGISTEIPKNAEAVIPHFIPKPYTAEVILQTLARVLRGE